MNFLRSIVAAIALSFACSVHAIVPGQTDTFEDGTTQNWTNGGFNAPPVVNFVGGPGGPTDHAIRVTSLGGSGAGNRLTTFNRDQWLGDYLNQGIIAVEMDLNNFSDVELSIRIGFKQEIGPGAPGYVSQAFVLPAGGGWQHVVFSITPATMIPLNSPIDYKTFFSGNFEEFRIIHAPTPDLNGEPVVAQMGIDNIHAVPEPTSFVLGAIGLLVVMVARRRGRPAKL